MIQSSWYQLIEDKRKEGLAEGREAGHEEGGSAEARRLLVLQGRKRLGESDASTIAAVEAASIAELESLAITLLEVESWADLLAAQSASRQ